MCVAQSTDCWGLSWGCCSSNSVTKGGLVLCIVGIFGYNLDPSESLGFVIWGFTHWQHLSDSSGCSLRIQNTGQEFRVGKNSAQAWNPSFFPPKREGPNLKANLSRIWLSVCLQLTKWSGNEFNSETSNLMRDSLRIILPQMLKVISTWKAGKTDKMIEKWLWNLYLPLLALSPAHPARVLAWKLEKTLCKQSCFSWLYGPDTKRWPLKVYTATCPAPTRTSQGAKSVGFLMNFFSGVFSAACRMQTGNI